MGDNMIEMLNVSKKYPNGITAVNNLNVKINQGEFVYVVGPSGAGKSTFIKMMYREVKATSGIVKIGKFDVTKLKERDVPMLRRYVGVVFQDFKLLPKLTIFENIAYAMEVIEKTPKQIEKRVFEVLDLVRLKHKARMFPNELSGGEQQRIAIARAIVNTPGILIADEPTGNLDPDTSMEIMAILEEINNQGTTILMATHNSQIVNDIKHRVLAIESGRIVRDQQEGEYGYEI
jgi:cell division transport system ATP-binding protein